MAVCHRDRAIPGAPWRRTPWQCLGDDCVARVRGGEEAWEQKSYQSWFPEWAHLLVKLSAAVGNEQTWTNTGASTFHRPRAIKHGCWWLSPAHCSAAHTHIANSQRPDRSAERTGLLNSGRVLCHGSQTVMGQEMTFFNIKMAPSGPGPEDRGCRWNTLPGQCLGLSCPVQRDSHSPVAFCSPYTTHTASYTDLKSMLTSFN